MAMGKPTGTSGFFRVQANPDGTIAGSFHQIAYSKQKAEVELETARAFVNSMNRELSKVGEVSLIQNPRINSEYDFDLTVSTSRGDAYLEMMEIQPGLPYDQASNSHSPYDLARVLYDGIQNKSRHYAHPGRKLFLLLYLTHWAFRLSNATLMCLRFWLARDKPVFDAIFSYQPFDSSEGDPRWLYPYPPELLKDFDPEAVRHLRFLNLDPQKFIVS
jgi:hypothetical protein